MSFISRIKEHYYNKSIAHLSNSNLSKRHKENMTFAAAQKVILLFDAIDLNTQQEVKKYAKRLKEQGKKVTLLGFFNDKEKRENIAFPYYNKKNIDWAGRVKSPEIESITKDTYDLLVNVNLISQKHTEHLICQINAKLKAGPVSANTSIYDFMIDLPGNANISTFLKQLEFYLRKINVRKTVEV